MGLLVLEVLVSILLEWMLLVPEMALVGERTILLELR